MLLVISYKKLVLTLLIIMKKILFISQYSPETRIVGDMIYTWDILRALKHEERVYVHFIAYQDKEKWYENETKNRSNAQSSRWCYW